MAFLITLIFEAAKGSIEWRGPILKKSKGGNGTQNVIPRQMRSEKQKTKRTFFLNSFH